MKNVHSVRLAQRMKTPCPAGSPRTADTGPVDSWQRGQRVRGEKKGPVRIDDSHKENRQTTTKTVTHTRANDIKRHLPLPFSPTYSSLGSVLNALLVARKRVALSRKPPRQQFRMNERNSEVSVDVPRDKPRKQKSKQTNKQTNKHKQRGDECA